MFSSHCTQVSTARIWEGFLIDTYTNRESGQEICQVTTLAQTPFCILFCILGERPLGIAFPTMFPCWLSIGLVNGNWSVESERRDNVYEFCLFPLTCLPRQFVHPTTTTASAVRAPHCSSPPQDLLTHDHSLSL